MSKTILTQSIGIEAQDDVCHPIFRKGALLPCQHTMRICTTEDNQTKMNIVIRRGECLWASENTTIGCFKLSGLKKRKKGGAIVEIIYEIIEGGLLRIIASELQSKLKVKYSTPLDLILESSEIAEDDKEDDMNFKRTSELFMFARKTIDITRGLLGKVYKEFSKETHALVSSVETSLQSLEQALINKDELSLQNNLKKLDEHSALLSAAVAFHRKPKC